MAGRYNFEIEQGATFSLTIVWTDDETGDPMWTSPDGWTAVMKIKNVLGGTTIISLTNVAGIELSTNGTIGITMTAVQTTAFSFDKAVYDLKLTSPTGVATRVLEGDITLDREVSA